MNNQVLSAIMDRRSIRAYKPDTLSNEQLETLIESAVNAPSAMNLQPWHICMVTDAALLNRMNAAGIKMAPDNERMQAPGYSVYYNAPAVLFVFGEPEKTYAATDCGMLTQNVCLAAQSMGLGTVIVGMWRFAFSSPEADEYRKLMGVPEGYNLYYGISIGYPDQSPEARPRDMAKVTRVTS